MRLPGVLAVFDHRWSVVNVVPDTVDMFGLRFDRVTLAGAVGQVMAAARSHNTSLVVTPNVDQIVRFDHDPLMHEVYRGALHVYADGMPLVWLSRLIGPVGLSARVTGADLLPAVCAAAAAEGAAVYFFGGDPGVAQLAADCLSKKFCGLKVAGVSCPPYGFERDEEQSSRLVDDINRSGADILFLGVGAPKQEKWGHRHLAKLRVGPVLCVGAAFSFAAGLAQRAPRMIQNSGFEWAWRLGREPRRLWRRYLVDDVRFFILAVSELQKARLRRRVAGGTIAPSK